MLARLGTAVCLMYISNFLQNDETVQEHLCEAIAQCCSYASNREAFGKEDAVVPLVKYLECNNPGVHRTTTKALHQLSKFPDNCITMHANGCVPVSSRSFIVLMYFIRRYYVSVIKLF